MKKIAAFILICSALMLSGGENLIPNGDFLQINPNSNHAPVGWWGTVDPKCGVDTEIKPENGVNSYRMAGGRLLSTVVPVKPGHVYKCSFVLKTEGFKWRTAATFQLLWRKKEKPLFVDYKGQKVWNMKIKNVQGGHNWTRFEMADCAAPDDADSVEIRLGQVFEPAGYCWFSKLRMEEVREGDPFRNRIAAVPRAAAGLSVENAFDESRWSNAANLSDYLQPVSGTRARFPSEMFVTYDNEAIWLFSRNYQSSLDKLDTSLEKRFDMQDGIEVFFLPPGREYQYHIMLPVTGKLFVCTEKWNDGHWPMKLHPWNDHGIEFKVKKEQDLWTAVLRIPFKGMGVGVPRKGEEWRANFCRTVFTGGKEATSWSFLREPHFQYTNDFGKIIFSENIPLIKKMDITADGANVEIRNTASTPVNVNLSLVKHTENKSFILAEKCVSVAPLKDAVIELSSKADSAAMRFLEIHSGDVLLRKHCNMPSEEYLALGVFDPENVRTQTLYLAVDTPFFMSLNMRHNFATKEAHRLIWRREMPVDLYMDLPAEIKVSGMTFDAGDWLKLPLFKPQITPYGKDGLQRKLYKFELPMIINWQENGFLFFYECNAPEDKMFSGSYYFSRNGKNMPVHEMTFRTMKVGRVKKCSRKMVFDPGLLRANTLRWWLPKNTVEQFKRLGFNRIGIICEAVKNKDFYTGDDPRTNEDYYDLIFKEMRDSGQKLFISTFNTSAGALGWFWTTKDPDARSVGYDGKPGPPNQYNCPSLCPSYRGKYYQEWVDRLANCSAFRKYRATWLALDMELWPLEVWEKICFCKRCIDQFKAFCLKNGKTDFAKRDVAAEIAGKKDKAFIDCWTEFKCELYSEFLKTAASRVEETVRNAPSTSPLKKFTVSDWTSPGPRLKPGILDYYEIAFFNSPDNNYHAIQKRMPEWKHRKDLYCSTTYGQTVACPDFHVIPEQVKENIFEAAALGMQGCVWYYVLYLEPRRMKAIIDGINAIQPFEDIILEGKLSSRISGQNKKMLLTRLDSGDEILIGIRAYGANTDLEGKIRLEGISLALALYDCETHEKIADVTPENPEFNYLAKKDRCRLIYAGPQDKWDARMKLTSEPGVDGRSM